jgi:hypothetical protein
MTRTNDNGIDRDMTADEQKVFDAGLIKATAQTAADDATFTATAAAKKSAEAKLAALGLTADEISAL